MITFDTGDVIELVFTIQRYGKCGVLSLFHQGIIKNTIKFTKKPNHSYHMAVVLDNDEDGISLLSHNETIW